MRELFRKYLDNNCSPDEVRRLLAHFKIGENETLLRKLIIEWLEENDAEEKDSRWQNNFYSVARLIKKQLNIESLIGLMIFRKPGFNVSAAIRLYIFL
ncbi:MAG TPA: hypothetical protein VIU35_10460 [Chitinophagaceae bacterium]